MHHIISMLFILLLVACGGLNTTPHSSQDTVEFKQLSTIDLAIDQHPANEAKNLIQANDALTNIYAVNTDKQMIVAFEIDHLKRFKLKQYEKDIEKELKDAFPELEVNVSTDQKIIIEIEQLERAIETNSMSEKELKEKLKHIIKLSKEET